MLLLKRINRPFPHVPSVRIKQIWAVDLMGKLEKLVYSPQLMAIISSSGKKVVCLEDNGIIRWTSLMDKEITGVGILPQQGFLAIAYGDEVQLLSKIGITQKRIKVSKPIKDMDARNILATLTEDSVVILDAIGRVHLELPFRGDSISLSKDRILLSSANTLRAISLKGSVEWSVDLDKKILGVAQIGEKYVCATSDLIYVLDKGGENVWQKDLVGKCGGMSADKYIFLHMEKDGLLLGSDAEEKWRFPGKVEVSSTHGDSLFVASGNKLALFEDVGNKDVFYEITCRGEGKCGTFVSWRYLTECPKCHSKKIGMRIVKRRLPP